MKHFIQAIVVMLAPAAIAAGPTGVATIAAQDPLPAAETLIERHLEAVGGRDAILAHTSSRVTGTFSMPAAGIQGTLETKAAAPNLSFTQVEIPGMGVIRSGFDGTVGWSVDPNLGPRLLEGNELAAVMEGASQLAAVRDESLFDVRETVERTEMNGVACYKVRLLWKSGRETFDCYGAETGLMIGTMARQESPMGAIETTTFIEDYRDFDGVLSATRIRQQMLGQEQIMTLDTVEYGVVDPDAFVPPEPIRALMEQPIDG